MNFIDLLKNSVQIFVKTRLIWLFAAVFAVYMAVTALMPVTSGADPQESLRLLPLICGAECLMLLLLAPMLFSSCGIIFAAGQAWRGQPVTLRDTWDRFKQRLLSLFLLTLAFMAFVIVLAVIVMIVLFATTLMANPENPSGMTSVISIGMMVVVLPLSILIGLGYVALMLDPQGGFDALTRGLKRFWSKIGLVLLSFIAYFVCFSAIDVLIGLAFNAVFGAPPLLPQFTGLYGQYIVIMTSPGVRVLNILLLPLLAPIYFIMLALIYEDAGGSQPAEPTSVIAPA